MGRPKLYKTPEERVLAARSYRAKYYESHKKEINQKVQAKRIRNRSNGKVQDSASVPLLGQPRAPSILSRRAGRPKRTKAQTDEDSNAKGPDETDTRTDDTMEQIQLTLYRTVRGSSRQFVDRLCNDYLESGDYFNIYNAVTAVEQLEGRLRAVQLASPQGHEGAVIAQKLRLVIRILEDLLLNAMEGNDIADLRRRGVLLYQSVDDMC